MKSFVITVFCTVKLVAAPVPYSSIYYYEPVSRVGREHLSKLIQLDADVARYLAPLFETLESDSRHLYSKNDFRVIQTFLENWAVKFGKHKDAQTRNRIARIIGSPTYPVRNLVPHLVLVTHKLNHSSTILPNQLTIFLPGIQLFLEHQPHTQDNRVRSNWEKIKDPTEKTKLGHLLGVIIRVGPKKPRIGPSPLIAKIGNKSVRFYAVELVELWAMQPKELRDANEAWFLRKLKEQRNKPSQRQQYIKLYQAFYRIRTKKTISLKQAFEETEAEAH